MLRQEAPSRGCCLGEIYLTNLWKHCWVTLMTNYSLASFSRVISMVGGGDGLGSSWSFGLAVFALGITMPREPCHTRQAPGTRDRSWARTQPLWVVQGYGPKVSCSLLLSLVPAGLLSLAHDCVPWTEPGPSRELKSNKYVLDSRISPDMVLHCLQNSFPSIISSDPYNNPER